MNRRQFNRSISLAGLSTFIPYLPGQSGKNLIHRQIPGTGEKIPVIGMGSWLTFDVGGFKEKEENMKSVLAAFYQNGGRVVDSSPMYGTSQEVIGRMARELDILDQLWISTKIWTDGKASGERQLGNSLKMFDNRVMVNHVHNLRDFKNHYETLKEAKASGKIKYIAVSHYLNTYHDDLTEVILKYKPDFIQVNYNIENPNAEKRLLPVARDNGVAVIINKPFQTGNLFRRIGTVKLPKWAIDYGIDNWASFMLKYIISNQAVTCTIPATRQVAHVKQNLKAGTGYIPNLKERNKMREYFTSNT